MLSALWYVTKAISSQSKTYKDKSLVFLILYSIYGLGISATCIWIVSMDSDKYMLILGLYALLGVISAWVLKMLYIGTVRPT